MSLPADITEEELKDRIKWKKELVYKKRSIPWDIEKYNLVPIIYDVEHDVLREGSSMIPGADTLMDRDVYDNLTWKRYRTPNGDEYVVIPEQFVNSSVLEQDYPHFLKRLFPKKDSFDFGGLFTEELETFTREMEKEDPDLTSLTPDQKKLLQDVDPTAKTKGAYYLPRAKDQIPGFVTTARDFFPEYTDIQSPRIKADEDVAKILSRIKHKTDDYEYAKKHPYRRSYFDKVFGAQYAYLSDLLELPADRDLSVPVPALRDQFAGKVIFRHNFVLSSGPLYHLLRNVAIVCEIDLAYMYMLGRKYITKFGNEHTLLWEMRFEQINPNALFEAVEKREIRRILAIPAMLGHDIILDIRFKSWSEVPYQFEEQYTNQYRGRIPSGFVEIRVNDSSEYPGSWYEETQTKPPKQGLSGLRIMKLLTGYSKDGDNAKLIQTPFLVEDTYRDLTPAGEHAIEEQRVTFFNRVFKEYGPPVIILNNIATPQRMGDKGCMVHSCFGLHFMLEHPSCVRPAALAPPRRVEETDSYEETKEHFISVTSPYQVVASDLSVDDYRLYMLWSFLAGKILDYSELKMRLQRKWEKGLGFFGRRRERKCRGGRTRDRL